MAGFSGELDYGLALCDDTRTDGGALLVGRTSGADAGGEGVCGLVLEHGAMSVVCCCVFEVLR